ncbi:acyl-CoA dehydrogenase family protein [Martelella lutilitoris]|uniref:Acyl-CoA dehydrogenase family protein n=1 Tax=Martelella lutilitoris TaxID=2583532 RepID=A0A7T7HIX0_9HYPH|nr:acyl-CoA dehydrogenase family protein [Martelella lutilitoris]QQM29995.1 acyl-CoA dehydrogenase family protein [Martelella lutilitoris]
MIRFELPTEEALLLKDTAERFVADHYALEQRAKALSAAPGDVPRHWAEMAELGWLVACVPEDAGGLGLTPAQIVPMMEVLGAGLILEPVGAVSLGCAAMLARALSPDDVAERLAPVLAGEAIEVVVAGRDGAPIAARREGGNLVLSGASPAVIGAAAATAFWVVAELDGSRMLVRIPAEDAAVTPCRLVDGQAAAQVVLDDVTVPADEAISGCHAALDFGADLALVGVLAETSGVIDALHKATLDYVKMREQFGRPIGRFQVVQHKMADMFIACEEARSMVLLAAEAMESKDAAFRGKLVSAARVKISDAARAVLRDAVQLHGGMGVSDELAVGHLVKRLLVLTQTGGNRAAHLKRFAKAA